METNSSNQDLEKVRERAVEIVGPWIQARPLTFVMGAFVLGYMVNQYNRGHADASVSKAEKGTRS